MVAGCSAVDRFLDAVLECADQITVMSCRVSLT